MRTRRTAASIGIGIAKGDLDKCNGRVGRLPEGGEGYYYVLTDASPFVPRCTVAAQDDSFEMRGGPPPGRRPF